jgi:hypothetical protein
VCAEEVDELSPSHLADAAGSAREEHRTQMSLARAAWLIADGVTPSAATAQRKPRCCATLRNASTPRLTVKLCFIPHQHYRE